MKGPTHRRCRAFSVRRRPSSTAELLELLELLERAGQAGQAAGRQAPRVRQGSAAERARPALQVL